MNRQVSSKVLDIFENWLSDSYACLKWDNTRSYKMFTIKFSVGQGSVLSPVLFGPFRVNTVLCLFNTIQPLSFFILFFFLYSSV